MAILMQTLQLKGELTVGSALTASLSTSQSLKGSLTVPEGISARQYEGAYEFTPTEDTQTVSTGGYQLEQNITINPIPSNYGLITWNGTTLTVS